MGEVNVLKYIDFGNEAGDDLLPEELEDIFVDQHNFRQYLDLKQRLLIITGKKGIGKSTILQWLSKEFKKNEEDAIILKCRGADLTRGQFGVIKELTTPNDYIRDWMVRIAALANRNLAKLIGFALTDDQHTLLETAELEGFKEKNFIGCLLNRITLKLDKIDVRINKESIKNEIEILKRCTNRKLIILIDDLDATFQNSDKEKLDLSAFFSACRYLMQDIRDIYIRVTLRTDVWPIIRRYDESLDKIEQYVSDITWNVEDFRKLLFKRINSQLVSHGQEYKQLNFTDEEYEEYIISKAFVKRMDWGEMPKQTYKVIYTLSYRRPRWAIQLCKLAKNSALKLNKMMIDKNDINNIWGEYGKKRIADLVSEHKHQCKVVEELIMSFRGSDRRMTRDELFIQIKNKILSHLSIVIDGQKNPGPVEIAHFLYRIGFIVARKDDGSDSYEHFHYDEMPDFLTSRTSNDFSVDWEIHPCYRQALDIKKLINSQRFKRGVYPHTSSFDNDEDV